MPFMDAPKTEQLQRQMEYVKKRSQRWKGYKKTD